MATFKPTSLYSIFGNCHLFKLAFNTGFEPVEAVSTAHGKSAPGLEYFIQARDTVPSVYQFHQLNASILFQRTFFVFIEL